MLLICSNLQYDYSSWKGKNVISVKDFTKQNVEEVLAVATRMKELVAKKGGCDVLNVIFCFCSYEIAPRHGQRLFGAFDSYCLIF